MAVDSELNSAYKDWTRAPERGSPWLIALIARIARRVPRAVARVLMWPIVLYFVLFSPRQAQASRRFLQRATGRAPRWSEVFRHYLTFSYMVLDRVYWLSDDGDAHRRIPVQVHGLTVIEGALRDRKEGLIVVGSHLGSFEALRGAGTQVCDRRLRPLMYVDNARKVQQVLDALNPALAADAIYAGRSTTMLEIRTAIANGDVVGILADRSPLTERTTQAPFMGSDASFPMGAYRLAAVLDVPVVFSCALIDGSGYRIHFESLPAREGAPRDVWIEAAARSFAAHLEEYARRYPYNWFNFYDFWSAHAPGAVDDAGTRSGS